MSQRERRLLVLAPVGKDAALIATTLAKDGVACQTCRNLDHLVSELQDGAGAILVAEEALAPSDERLGAVLRSQPPWSDIPVLLLTYPRADSPTVAHAADTMGNVTLIERPVRMGALTTSVRAALRARQRQYESRAYLREREEADERKNEFLATLAHELRNPLAPIRTSLEIMRLSGSGVPPRGITAIMERQVNHLVRLVDDLIDVARITRGKIELRKERVHLNAVIADAVETSRPLIDAAGHQLELTLPRDDLVVDADPMRLAQIFSNLLNNAATYTDAGGRISVDVREADGSAVVTVADTGIGIAPDALSRVFELFAQADAPTRKHAGLGIGLTLARGLVELHGGTLTASSDGLGCGSRFVVRLPLCKPKIAAAAPAGGAQPAIRPGQRVLVVDDNRDAADALAALMEMLGVEVRVAYDGATALNAMDSFQPALVVLDLGMPEMDGYEVARRIRERPDAAAVRLVALTGWGQDAVHAQVEEAGFNAHLVKPIDMAAMRAMLQSVN